QTRFAKSTNHAQEKTILLDRAELAHVFSLRIACSLFSYAAQVQYSDQLADIVFRACVFAVVTAMTGFGEVQHVSAATLAQRYFVGRTDGLRPPNNSEELLLPHSPGLSHLVFERAIVELLAVHPRIAPDSAGQGKGHQRV